MGKFIDRLNSLGRRWQSLIHVTVIADALAGFARRSSQRLAQAGTRFRSRWAAIPIDLQGLAPLHSSPGGIGHDHDSARSVHILPQRRNFEDVAYSGHCLGFGCLKMQRLAAKRRATGDHRKHHFRNAHIETKPCAAVDLRWNIHARRGMADQFEFGFAFQRNFFLIRQRQLGGRFDQFAISRVPRRLLMGHGSIFGDALRLRNIPSLGRSRDHQLANACAGSPQGHEILHGAATAARAHVLVDVRPRLRLLYADCIEIHVCFFRENHGQPGLDSLPHFGFRHNQRNVPVRVHVDVSIERIYRTLLLRLLRLLRKQHGSREPEAHKQACSGNGAAHYEISARDGHGYAPSPVAR